MSFDVTECHWIDRFGYTIGTLITARRAPAAAAPAPLLSQSEAPAGRSRRASADHSGVTAHAGDQISVGLDLDGGREGSQEGQKNKNAKKAQNDPQQNIEGRDLRSEKLLHRLG